MRDDVGAERAADTKTERARAASPRQELRDYFALQVMPIIARHRYDQLHDLSPEPIAHYAYALADAMLAERAKP